ncbi:DUF4384 domain-containing protein [Verrucomicrobium sp. BvORR034]|uniref:DUF4384 domain-containing protein n=1 Tax=Verrucomicrobium sp. BvORR034 TaxID=1396418 RepID=UPI0006789C4B|nr:DUF4384 domain-containing protein [Verrucomicrobium sp. BvORR034]
MVRPSLSSAVRIACAVAVVTLTAGCKKESPTPPATQATATPAAEAAASGVPSTSTAPTTAETANLHPAGASEGPFQITTNQPSYQTGDRQKVSVRTPESGWLYVGAINADGGVLLYYPNPSQPSGKVFKDRTINLPPESGLRAEEMWDINTALPEGVNKSREIVFAILSHQPIADLKLDWGVDQRDALTKAGILAEGAKPTTPGSKCFPPTDKHQVAWREYDITRAPEHVEKPAP